LQDWTLTLQYESNLRFFICQVNRAVGFLLDILISEINNLISFRNFNSIKIRTIGSANIAGLDFNPTIGIEPMVLYMPG